MSLPDWNVLVTVYDDEYGEAVKLLAPFGRTERTAYYNVLTMQVDDVHSFLEALRQTLHEDASLGNAVSRIVPVTRTFRFESPEDFERKACEAVTEWMPELTSRTFHVRMHRRGFKGRLSSQHEEQFLDHFVTEQAKLRGATSTVDFENPDFIIAVETLGQEAGLSLWSRQQLADHELLRLD